MKSHLYIAGILYSMIIVGLSVLPVNTASAQEWRNHYQSISDDQSIDILHKSLTQAVDMFGEPEQPISKIHLRLSKALPGHQHKLKENFQLTEAGHADDSEMTVYLSRTINDYSFVGQLAHETVHLLNPHIYDAYYEGLCTLFSQKFVKDNKLDWNRWAEYYEQEHDPFYAHTYFMMKEIADIVGIEALYKFHTFTMKKDKNSKKLSIDIDRWLSTIPEAQRQIVKDIIEEYSHSIKEAITQTHQNISFHLPGRIVKR